MTHPATAESLPSASSLHGESVAWRRWLLPLTSLVILVIAGIVVRDELGTTTYHAVMHTLSTWSRRSLLGALALTGACYAVLPLYDVLGLRYARTPIPLRKSRQASLFAYAFSQTLGFAAITGGAFDCDSGPSGLTIRRSARRDVLRHWFLDRLAGRVRTGADIQALPSAAIAYASSTVFRAIGIGLLGVVLSYLVLASVRRRPIVIGGVALTPPGVVLTALQVVVAAADWTLAAAVLWALLPATPGLGFVAFLGSFALAQAIGLASHVPGGLGVFDSLMVVLLTPVIGAPLAIAALVAYRAVYYLLPFMIAALMLAVMLARRRQRDLANAARFTARLAGRWGRRSSRQSSVRRLSLPG
ncbi:MAG: UPF0104 family protein [Gemmatimonadaceae bacterium]|nr:UPF0104 family protein [Gemmatimonadaceae bacterium]